MINVERVLNQKITIIPQLPKTVSIDQWIILHRQKLIDKNTYVMREDGTLELRSEHND